MIYRPSHAGVRNRTQALNEVASFARGRLAVAVSSAAATASGPRRAPLQHLRRSFVVALRWVFFSLMWILP